MQASFAGPSTNGTGRSPTTKKGKMSRCTLPCIILSAFFSR